MDATIEVIHWAWPEVIKRWPPSLRANYITGGAQLSAELEMVNTCVVFGCKHQGSKGGISFYSIPAVIHSQGDKTRQLSLQRRHAWL